MKRNYHTPEQEYALTCDLDAVLEIPTSGKTYREQVLNAAVTVGTWAQIATRVYTASGKARAGETNRAIRDTLIELQDSVELCQVGYDTQGNALYIRIDKAGEYLTAHQV